jgi:Tol biopolymer transport system component
VRASRPALLALALLVGVPLHAQARTPTPTFAVTVGPGPPYFNAGLWIVRGHVARNIVPLKRTLAQHPSWSPNGRRLVFTIARDPVVRYREKIFVVDFAGGGHLHRLTKSGRGIHEYSPAWSPDGQTVAFTRSKGNTAASVWLAASDGRSARHLVSGSSPAWSPDGKSLVFTHGSFLWTIRRDGSRLRQLTSTSSNPDCDFTQGDYDGSPDWSPDGHLIAFVRYCGSTINQEENAIYVIRPDGTELRLLTDDPSDDSPSWTAGGRSLAFVRLDRVMTVLRAGGNPRRVFAPAGREVYEVAWRG